MSELPSPHPFDCRSDEACIGRIFLVHLSLDACPAGHFCGRVQHVRSEDATHFSSFAELSHFMYEHVEIQAGSAGVPDSTEKSNQR